MQKVFTRFILSFLSVALLIVSATQASSTMAASEGSSKAKIGTVEINRIINPEKVELSAAKQFAEEGQRLQNEIATRSADLQKKDAALREEQQKMQEAARSNKDGQLSTEQSNELFGKMQGLMAENQQLQSYAQNESMKLQNDFQRKLKAAAKAIQGKDSYDMILPSDIILAGNTTDVTQKVIDEMNRQYDSEKRAKKAAAPKAATK